MTRGESDGAGRSLSMTLLDSHAKKRSLPLLSGCLGGRVIFRCALWWVVGGSEEIHEELSQNCLAGSDASLIRCFIKLIWCLNLALA